MPDIQKNCQACLTPVSAPKGLQQADRRGHGNEDAHEEDGDFDDGVEGEDIELPGGFEVNMAVFLGLSFSYDLR